MTHDPEQQRDAGGEPYFLPYETTPPMPGHAPHAGADWEVLAGLDGPERERTLGSPIRDLWQRQSARVRTVTTAATIAVLTLGGTVAYAATSPGSDQNAVPAASSESESSSPDNSEDRPRFGMGFGFGGDAVHGESTVRDGDSDEWVVRVWQRGTVEDVDGDQVTVKSEDGTEWTWTVDEDTTVYADGEEGSGAEDLKEDETAYLSGTRSDDDSMTAAYAMSGTAEDKGWGGWRGGPFGQDNQDDDDDDDSSSSDDQSDSGEST